MRGTDKRLRRTWAWLTNSLTPTRSALEGTLHCTLFPQGWADCLGCLGCLPPSSCQCCRDPARAEPVSHLRPWLVQLSLSLPDCNSSHDTIVIIHVAPLLQHHNTTRQSLVSESGSRPLVRLSRFATVRRSHSRLAQLQGPRPDHVALPSKSPSIVSSPRPRERCAESTASPTSSETRA